MVVVVEYDAEDKPDQPEALGKLGQIAQVAYDPDNVEKWFRRLERRMETGGVGSQWAKKLVLESALPAVYHDDLDDLFDRRKANCGNVYLECKTLHLSLHGASPERDFDLAM